MGLHRTVLLLGSLLAGVLALAQTSPQNSTPLAQDPEQIIKFLTGIVSWHRQLAAEQQIAQASDLTVVQENRRVADQVVQLGFDYARSQAQLQSKHPATPAPQADSGVQYQGLTQAAQQVEKDVQDTEAELQSVREKLANAPSQNNDSIVVRVRIGEKSFLFTGDIEKEAEAAMLKTGVSLRCDIVKVPHHGSRTSSTTGFVSATRVSLAIVSVGRTSIFGHPNKEVVERWRASGAQVMTTGEKGTISVATDGQAISVTTYVK